MTEDAKRFYAIANVSRSAPSVRIDFQGVTPHPDYNDQNIDNDIAILKTTEPIQMGTEVRPICIAAPDSDTEYENATAMGWGKISRRKYTTISRTNLFIKQNATHRLKAQIGKQWTCVTQFPQWSRETGLKMSKKRLIIHTFLIHHTWNHLKSNQFQIICTSPVQLFHTYTVEQ